MDLSFSVPHAQFRSYITTFRVFSPKSYYSQVAFRLSSLLVFDYAAFYGHNVSCSAGVSDSCTRSKGVQLSNFLWTSKFPCSL